MDISELEKIRQECRRKCGITNPEPVPKQLPNLTPLIVTSSPMKMKPVPKPAQREKRETPPVLDDRFVKNVFMTCSKRTGLSIDPVYAFERSSEWFAQATMARQNPDGWGRAKRCRCPLPS